MRMHQYDPDRAVDNPKFYRVLMIAFAVIAFIFAMGIVLMGCMSHAQLARKCAIEFPPKTFDSTRIEVINGETVYHYDTVMVDCDSIVAANHVPDLSNKIRTSYVRIPCPPSTSRVDTINTTSVRQVENTAKVEVLTKERDGARIDKARIQNGRNSWRLIALLALGYTAIRIVVKLWFKINLP